MKNILTQAILCLSIFVLVWGMCVVFPKQIGWSYMYLIIAGYLLFIVLTSNYNWIVTTLQFLIVGFLSFVIIGSLYNELYEPFIERYFYRFEGEIATSIGIMELIFIKIFSDFILAKTNLQRRDSIIEKLLLPTKPKLH